MQIGASSVHRYTATHSQPETILIQKAAHVCWMVSVLDLSGLQKKKKEIQIEFRFGKLNFSYSLKEPHLWIFTFFILAGQIQARF